MTRSITQTMLNDPFFIGFDRVVDRMLSATPGQSNYPPYNIVKLNDEEYQIQVAVAGFNRDEIDIEVKDGVLTITGEKESEDETNFLYKGISARQFRRRFTLNDTVEVQTADLSDGILTIDLVNIIPDARKPRKIAIGLNSNVLEGEKAKAELLTEEK